jgi:hypothetical protein
MNEKDKSIINVFLIYAVVCTFFITINICLPTVTGSPRNYSFVVSTDFIDKPSGTILKSNRHTVETEANNILLTCIYMTSPFPVLENNNQLSHVPLVCMGVSCLIYAMFHLFVWGSHVLFTLFVFVCI